MHQAMLADRPRLAAYDRALAGAIKAGDTVLDVGAGLLALSLLALRHGAGRVYAIEADPQAAEVAERIILDNELKDRITLIQGDARAVRLPGRADVVVAELMGNLGPEENMMGLLGTVARRNLRPGGTIVPARLKTQLAAIEFDDEGWGLWQDDFHGYRLGAVRETARPQAHLHFFQRPPRLLGPPVVVRDEVAGNGRAVRRKHQAQRLAVTEPGRLHAIAGYFSAELADGVNLTNFPSYPGCNWAVWVWPLRHTPVEPGDEIRAELHSPAEDRAARVATDWWLDCGIVRSARRS